MRWLQALVALVIYVWLAFGVLMAVIHFTYPAESIMTRRISAAGLAHIKHFEGCKLKSYYCVANRCTIGYGHAGPEVKPGMVITQERAEELLRRDLDKAERAVEELVKVPITQGQADAIIDLIFNVGRDAVAKSTLLKLLNKRQYGEAGNQLMRWVHSGGAIVSGLQRRRQAARNMWFERG